MSSRSNTIDSAEIAHFSKDAPRWWDEDGPFRPLHRLNPVRMDYINEALTGHFGKIKGLKILDAGCGGGLVCEPLARLGANVTGIDADSAAIAVAKDHAADGGLKITYKTGTAGDLKGSYDAVLALEIVEHVTDLDQFVTDCAALCKPGGLLIFSTLNRTLKSFALGIVAAEYMLRWVPRGTHDWRKFVKPSELATALRHANSRPIGQKGLVFEPVKGEFALSHSDIDVNYFMTAEKQP